MSYIIAVANQKGGVGKTTTAINLAASLAAAKRRVLLVDLDAQGNATMGVGVNKNEVSLTAYDWLLGGAAAGSVVKHLDALNLWLIPGNEDLTAAEVELRARNANSPQDGALVLRRAIENLVADGQNFDYIVLDCPPALSMMTLNALSAADGVLIPMQCEYYALEGLTALKDTIDKVKGLLNPRLEIEGIVRTMYDPRNNLALQVSEQLQKHFGDKLYRSMIPRNVRLAEAPSHGLPALGYDAQSTGARAYLAMAGELLRRHDQRVPAVLSAAQ